MKLRTSSLFACSLLILMACHSNKKTTVATTTPAPAPASSDNTVAAPAPQVYGMAAPAGVIPEPGETELNAIQATYKNVSMEDLKSGHRIYTKGACIGCHPPQSISKYPEGQWKGIILDMAQKAMLSEADRDAVYKFVMAVKATETKGSK